MSESYLPNGKTALMRAEDVDRYTSLDAINQPGVRGWRTPAARTAARARVAAERYYHHPRRERGDSCAHRPGEAT